MMYEAFGKGADYPPRAITRRGLDKLLVIGEHEAYCQPCVSPVWDTALTCHALIEAGGGIVAAGQAGARLAEAEAGAGRQGRLGRETPRRAAGRLGVPVQQRLLPRSGRYRGRGHGDGSRAAAVRKRRIRHRDRARPRVDRGHAEPRWRLGRVRRQQPRILPQQHPVLRPWRAARSADRGRHRALRFDAGATRRDRRRPARRSPTGSPISAAPSWRKGRGTAAGG